MVVDIHKEKTVSRPRSCFIDPAPIRRITHSLSYQQEGMWLFEETHPGTVAANCMMAFEVRGAFSLPAFQEAYRSLLRDHDVLRTVITIHEGWPRQEVQSDIDPSFRYFDFTGTNLPAAETFRALLAGAGMEPFDVARGPLTRLLVGAFSDATVVALVQHHLVTDGWSIAILCADFCARYNRLVKGDPLRGGVVQYASAFAGNPAYDRKAGKTFWKNRLAGVERLTRIPADRESGEALPEGKSFEWRIGRRLSDAIRRRIRAEGVTPFAYFLAVLGLSARRFTGDSNLLIFTDISDRNTPEAERALGLFVNRLPVAFTVDRAALFPDYLREVADSLLEVLEHRQTPLHEIMEDLGRLIAHDRQLTFHLLCDFQSTPSPNLTLEGALLDRLDHDTAALQGDLVLSIRDHGDHYAIKVIFNRRCYEEATVKRFVEDFEYRLELVLDQPDGLLGDLLAPTPREHHAFIREWTDVPFGRRPRRHGLDEFPSEVPDRVALVSSHGCVTYGAQNLRISRVALGLIERGVRPDDLVAVLFSNPADATTAIYATLRAGGAYLPLDVQQPRSYLLRILDELKPKVILSDVDGIEGAGPLPPVDFKPLSPAEQSRLDEAQTRIAPANLAYVIATSGTTGTPKKIAVARESLEFWINVRASVAYLAGPFLLLSPLHWDASLFGLFWPRISAMPLVVLEDDERRDPVTVAQAMERFRVHATVVAPTFYQLLLEGLEPVESLRLVHVGGERWPAGLVRRHFERLPHARLRNEYGPTEATNTTNFFEVDSSWAVAPPIGRFLPFCRGYVLDGDLVPVPIGTPGELFLGGPSVSRGYVGEPGQTASRFLPDPFWPGGRMYRTGDLCKVLPDGCVSFIKRIDQQIKSKGHRIDPFEVEAALLGHARVGRALVFALPDGELAAACILEGDSEGREAEPAGIGRQLRMFLKDRLPAYMVPPRIAIVPRFPEISSGKVDLPRLAEEVRRTQTEPAGDGFGDDLEHIVADVWQSLLGSRPTRASSFFEMGGHSVTAMKLVSRYRSAFGVRLRVSDVFSHPGWADQCAVIRRGLAGEDLAGLPELRPAGSREPALAASAVQRRFFYQEQLGPESAGDVVEMPFEVDGALRPLVLVQAAGALVARHEILRTLYRSGNGGEVEPCAQAALPPEIVFVDCRALDLGAEPAVRGRATAKGFCLSYGPIARLILTSWNARKAGVALQVHHVAADGETYLMMWKELAEDYHAFSAGLASPVYPPLRQYADYASWEKDYRHSPRFAQDVAFWKALKVPGESIAGRPWQSQTPGNVSESAGDTVPVHLPAELAHGIARLARERETTVFTILLSAFFILLRDLTASENLIACIPVHTKDQEVLARTAGCFLNLLPVAVAVPRAAAFDDVLAEVKSFWLKALNHRHVPFDDIVRAIQKDGRTGRLDQVFFRFDPDAQAEIRTLPGLRLSSRPGPVDRAKRDFTLYLWSSEKGIDGAFWFRRGIKLGKSWPEVVQKYESIIAKALDFMSNSTEKDQNLLTQTKKSMSTTQLAAGTGFRKGMRRELAVAEKNLVSRRFFPEFPSFPLVIEPATAGVDLPNWAALNKGELNDELLKVGAILFRGFGVRQAEVLQDVAKAISGELMGHYEKSSPRSRVSGDVFTSTDHPPEQEMLMHNATTYSHRWPMKLWFCCSIKAPIGGQTPIADCRKVLQFIDPEIREKFRAKKIMYMRNFGDGMGMNWPEVFGATTREEVEEYCRSVKIQFEWKDGDRLRTRQVRNAIRVHPITGEEVWLNQAHLFHVSTLSPETRDFLIGEFGEENLPSQSYYGDGSPIETDVIKHIVEAYNKAETCYDWEEGDVVMLDNMLAAHTRRPYSGNRLTLMAIAEPYIEQI